MNKRIISPISDISFNLIKSNSNLTSITNGPRQSNFELLRIISMFLVLIVHADFLSLGIPSKIDFINDGLIAVNKTIVQCIAIVCVNVFILISGWFGIKQKKIGFFNFIFQCLFFYILIYSILIAFKFRIISFIDIRKCFLFAPNTGWFVLSYIGLFILSPIINEFINNTTKEALRNVLLSFYGFQTFVWLGGGVSFFESGYSTISFIGLYLLGRYLKLYVKKDKPWLLYFLFFVLVLTFLFISTTLLSIKINVFAYNNPLVVAGASLLILWASNLKIKTNILINWVSKSTFAVYLFHCNPFTLSYYIVFCKKLYNEYSGIEYVIIMGCFIISVFILAIIIDQFRIMIWNGIMNFKNRIMEPKNLISR